MHLPSYHIVPADTKHRHKFLESVNILKVSRIMDGAVSSIIFTACFYKIANEELG